MEPALPYVLACVGALEAHVLMCKYGYREYAHVGAAIGSHIYVLSKDTWIRVYGLHGLYLCILGLLILLMELAVPW